MSDENRAILQEVNDAKSWVTAVKVAPVWARENTGTRNVASREGDTTSHPGDMICRGPDGETWTQGAEKFAKKYNPTGEKDGQGFEKYLPDPETTKVMAAQVTHVFHVVTTRGKLEGQPGDYLIKSAADRDEEFPSSIWIVGEEIFDATYQKT